MAELQRVNAAAAQRAKESAPSKKRRKQSHTEYMKQFVLDKLALLTRDLFVCECVTLGLTWKKNYLDYLV